MFRFLIISSIFIHINLFAQYFSSVILQDKKAGILSETDALFLQATAMYASDKLPDRYKNLDLKPDKCGFGIQCQIRQKFNQFSAEQKLFLQKHLQRPNLPYSLISPEGLFKIHYTTFGTNAVSTEDNDLSGIPDYVEEVAKSMDNNYQVEVISLGLNSPPSDNNKDGPEWDVYIKNLPNNYGWTNFDEQISTNPTVWTSYIEIDNNYTHTSTPGLDGMRVTTAHEFFHMIQLGYNFRNSDIFLMEVGATWMEDVVYDDINDYYFYLDSFFQSTNTRFNKFDGSHEYGLCIWFHFMEKRLQTRQFAADVWEYIMDYPALQALDHIFKNYNTNFQDELTLFYVWNYMTKSRADTINYYPEGGSYPEITDSDMDGVYSFTADTSISDIITSTGAKYYKLITDYGDSCLLIPVNTDTLFSYNSNSNFTFKMTTGWQNYYQLRLTENIFCNFSSADYINMKCTAIVYKSGSMNEISTFNATAPYIEDSDDIPVCFPNPFIPRKHNSVTFPFILNADGNIKINIFAPSGYLVMGKEIVYNGTNSIYWHGRNMNGETVSSGIYTFIITFDNRVIKKGKIAVID